VSLQVTAGQVRKVITLWQNYYPEGGWGWAVIGAASLAQALATGNQLAFSALALQVRRKFGHVSAPNLGKKRLHTLH
jgi:hypothetical protein